MADGGTRNVGGRYEFNAPAEVVFGVLTDPDRVYRWLPSGVRAESAEPDRVRIRVAARTYEYQVLVVPERLELRWESPGHPIPHGSAVVEDGLAGGSVVRAEVNLPQPDRDRRAQDLLDEAMHHLARDVSDNFNAG